MVREAAAEMDSSAARRGITCKGLNIHLPSFAALPSTIDRFLSLPFLSLPKLRGLKKKRMK